MAVPVYATELTDITTDSDAFTTVAGGGALTTNETDFYIQGSNCLSKATQASWDNNTYGGALHDDGANRTIPTNGAVFAWIYWWGPNVLATEANGGFALAIGNLTTAYKTFEVRGSDNWEFGGWECVPVDPNTFWASSHRTVGAPDGTYRWFGAEARVASATNIAKGNPFGLDAIRYGRGELRCTDGDVTNGYASFGGSSPDTGAAAWDNAVARRYGLLTPRNGAYFQQGLFIMGLAGTAVDFRDSNRVIFIQNTKKVTSLFNGFEIRNASSRVDWTNISVQALGTVSRGYFTVVDNADVNLDTCTFTDMDTFTFLAATAALSCTFRRCNAVTATGSDLRGSGFRTPTVAADASGLVWTDVTETDGLLDNATFSKGTNDHHAVSFASTTTDVDYTLRNIDFSGFNATPASNDSAIYVAATTGTITIYLIGCTGNITAKSAGAAVTFISDPVTVTVTTKDVDGAVIGSANVFLKAASGGSGILPVSATVNTITRISTTATATHAAVHNMSTGDKVYIQGANQDVYNGVFTITVTTTTAYTYTIASDPGTNATGTLTATFVFLKDTTNAGTGVLSMSRVVAADQNVIGWARKSSNPYYKEGIISGTVSSSGDTTFSPVLISDD